SYLGLLYHITQSKGNNHFKKFFSQTFPFFPFATKTDSPCAHPQTNCPNPMNCIVRLLQNPQAGLADLGG
ncbi:MAG: hypothetical protein ACUVXF_09065, partial [Desulfobaccales bacterium]